MNLTRLLTNSGIFLRLLLRIRRNECIILLYHGVRKKEALPGLVADKHVSQDMFDEQMKFARKHFNIISLDELVKNCRSGRLKPNSLVITFDDGYRNNYTAALPILKKYHIPATIFVLPGLINDHAILWASHLEEAVARTCKTSVVFNNQAFPLTSIATKNEFILTTKRLLKSFTASTKNKKLQELLTALDYDHTIPSNDDHQLLNWDEIRMMQENNTSFGSHTMTHELLTQIKPPRQTYEINESYKQLRKELPATAFSFAYPNGNYNASVKKIVQTNYTCAVSTIYGRNRADADLFELKRIFVSGACSLHHFKLNLFFNATRMYQFLKRLSRPLTWFKT